MAAILKWIITYAIIRTLISIGVGIVSYGAVIYTIHVAIGYLKAAYNSMPVEVLQFAALIGIPEAFGIVVGALIAATSLRFMRRLAVRP